MKIESAEENGFIKRKIHSSGSTGSYWIGLSYQVQEKLWKWTDGSLLSNGDYSNWMGLNPNNAGDDQDCGEIDYNGEWNDCGCHSTQGFICKKESF